MEIYIEKIAMIRPLLNQKNTSLNLDVDWSVEYTDTDQRDIKYNIINILPIRPFPSKKGCIVSN